MADDHGLAGFVLICRVPDLSQRELMVRWVAQRHRRIGKVNLALIIFLILKLFKLRR